MHALAPRTLRLSAFALATLLVAALVAAALFARFVWQGAAPSPEGATVEYLTAFPPYTRAGEGEAPATRDAHAQAPAVLAPGEAAPAAQSALAGVLAAARCATSVSRREENPHCADAPGFAGQGGRDIAPAPVDGVRTREGVIGRTVMRAAQARVENYARGEAQRYADPREDPLYEEGTDPATAAMRPCPPGSLPHGDGRGVNGRTCQPVR